MSTSSFDNIASGYDQQFTETATGRLQRAQVHRYLENHISPEMAVLELNCGTGEDAVWLAQGGCQVLATDLSPEMVALAAAKTQAKGLSQRIQTRALDLRALRPDILAAQVPDLASGQFDLVLSNFGGLNCLSPAELRHFGAALPALLKPGSLFVAVVMGRFCWWETLYFLIKGPWRAAFRRRGRSPVDARLNAQTTVPTWYYSPDEFRRFFPNLEIKTVQPVGIWLPPSYLDPWFTQQAGLLQILNFLEIKCRGRLWAGAADHFLLVLEKREG